MSRIFKIAISVISIAAGYTIIGLRAFYPYHRALALTLYIASVIFLVLAAKEQYKKLGPKGVVMKMRLAKYFPHFVVAVILAFFFRAAWVLVPVEPSPLANMTDQQLKADIEQDLKLLSVLQANLDALLDSISKDGLFQKDIQTLGTEDKTLIKDLWHEYLTNCFELDLLRRKYRGFYQIDYLVKPGLHADAFIIALTSLTEQFSSAIKLTELINSNILLETFLNEQTDKYTAKTYYRLKQQLTNPDMLLQLSAGAGYLHLVKKDTTLAERSLNRLRSQIDNSFKSLGKGAKIFVQNPLESLERAAFFSWYPLQKNVALQLSLIRTTDRDFFIPTHALKNYKQKLMPGDILLERRNWFMSNIGIPGFWPHVAFFIGTLEDIDKTFSGIDMLAGKVPSAYLKEKFPLPCESMAQQDEYGFPKSVIEALKNGIVLTSFEHSGNADYLAVLRPRLSMEQKFKAIIRALGYYGRPYDYNFDFATDNALVCSELVYKAFEDSGNLSLQPVTMNGRTIIPPNLIAQKFDELFTKDTRQFDLILYLEGNEKQESFFQRDVSDFRKTWQYPKWDIMQK
jgi:RNAse (barnase) inhibitor barstar